MQATRYSARLLLRPTRGGLVCQPRWHVSQARTLTPLGFRHGIAGQLPDTHVHFQRGAENLAMRFRNVQPDTAPWMQYRDTT